jgi:hypothetical protein
VAVIAEMFGVMEGYQEPHVLIDTVGYNFTDNELYLCGITDYPVKLSRSLGKAHSKYP